MVFSAALVFLRRTGAAIQAGYATSWSSVTGGLLLLAGIFLLYHRTGSIAITAFDPHAAGAAQYLILAGFLLNAVCRIDAWLLTPMDQPCGRLGPFMVAPNSQQRTGGLNGPDPVVSRGFWENLWIRPLGRDPWALLRAVVGTPQVLGEQHGWPPGGWVLRIPLSIPGQGWA